LQKKPDQKYPGNSKSLLVVFLVSSYRERSGVVNCCWLLYEPMAIPPVRKD